MTVSTFLSAHRSSRLGLAGVPLLLMLSSCGSGTDAAPDVASLSGATDAAAEAVEAEPLDTAQAALDFTQCMRDNGVEMDDPTFDADGNLEGGLGFGRGAADGTGVDVRSDDFQAAMEGCSGLIEDLDLGGQGANGFDRSSIEDGLLAYTSCLRDEGLSVDDITLGGPGAGPGDAAGAAGDGANLSGGTPPEGGFAGADRPAPGEDGAPGGAGFDPTARIVEQLGVDQDDPEVSAALDACAPVLESAFTAIQTPSTGSDS